MADNNDNSPNRTMVLLPAGTTIFAPNDIHEVTVQFPDADSAIVFMEWLKQICIDTERQGYSEL